MLTVHVLPGLVKRQVTHQYFIIDFQSEMKQIQEANNTHYLTEDRFMTMIIFTISLYIFCSNAKVLTLVHASIQVCGCHNMCKIILSISYMFPINYTIFSGKRLESCYETQHKEFLGCSYKNNLFNKIS